MKGPIINGDQYQVVVLRILEWDAMGRPSKAEVGYDDTTFALNDETKSIRIEVRYHSGSGQFELFR